MTRTLYEKDIKRGELLESLERTRIAAKHCQMLLSMRQTDQAFIKAADKVGYALFYIAGAMFAVSRDLEGYKGMTLEHFTERNKPRERNHVSVNKADVVYDLLEAVNRLKRDHFVYSKVIGESEHIRRYLGYAIDSLLDASKVLENAV